MLDKRMLDPRRPKGPPTPEDQLEQLIPYQQILVMSPLLYATHSKQVAQISGEPQLSYSVFRITGWDSEMYETMFETKVCSTMFH